MCNFTYISDNFKPSHLDRDENIRTSRIVSRARELKSTYFSHSVSLDLRVFNEVECLVGTFG